MLTYDGRLAIVAGGERAGKSFTAALYLTARAPFGDLFWLVGPDYEQARAEFQYTIDFLDRLGAIEGKRAVSMPRVGKASVKLKTGQLIETKSAEEVQKLASKAPDGIIMCEAAQHSYESYLKCLGRVAEKRGWLLMVGTFEGSLGWYPELFSEFMDPTNELGARAFSLPSWENTFVYPGGYDDAEIKRLREAYKRVPGLFEERIGAIPTPPIGLVFREFKRLFHVSSEVTFDANRPVFLAVDPSGGGAPYSVLACQFKLDLSPGPDEIDYCTVIDEIYETGKTGEEIIQITKKQKWFENVPHAGTGSGGAIDVEAPDEQKRWRKLAGIHLNSEKIPQLQGIRRLKSFLYLERDERSGKLVRAPHLLISPKVESLPHEFSKYRRKDPTDSALIPREEPPSNQPNHSIKALWYLLISRYGYIKVKPKYKTSFNWSARK